MQHNGSFSGERIVFTIKFIKAGIKQYNFQLRYDIILNNILNFS